MVQGTKGYSHAAKKVASTDTLGSDAAFDIESNESLSLYGKMPPICPCYVYGMSLICSCYVH